MEANCRYFWFSGLAANLPAVLYKSIRYIKFNSYFQLDLKLSEDQVDKNVIGEILFEKSAKSRFKKNEKNSFERNI